MNKTILAVVLGTLLAFPPATAFAQDQEASDDSVNTGGISIALGADVFSDYFFRGILQENQGVIFQPWADITFSLFESDTSSASVTVGTWNSLHDGPTGSGGPNTDPQAWYESDFYVSGALTAGMLTVGGGYIAYTSPNDAFTRVEEVNLTVSIDDSNDNWAGLQPSIMVVWETDGQTDAGNDLGVYFQADVEPGITVGPLKDSFPATVGVSLDEYYESAAGNDQTFGWAQVGVAAAISTDTSRHGTWTLDAGVHRLWLSEQNEAINNGDGAEWIAKAGLTIKY